VPEISRFFGIVIKLHFREHPPAHFHAEYGEHQALVNIHTLTVLHGHLPPRAWGLVAEWAALHQDELLDLWARARRGEDLPRIAPLQ